MVDPQTFEIALREKQQCSLPHAKAKAPTPFTKRWFRIRRWIHLSLIARSRSGSAQPFGSCFSSGTVAPGPTADALAFLRTRERRGPFDAPSARIHRARLTGHRPI